MTGGNFCWKFLDICEVKLFVTAWTMLAFVFCCKADPHIVLISEFEHG